MSEQDNGQVSTLQRPTNDDSEAWKAYWETQGQPWRTEPEIDIERQKYLAERRNITSSIEQGIYPFKDIRLSRADVEWLLATHESKGMRGPVNWNDERQRERQGLDLRGANLSQEDLSNLPLACMQGKLTWRELASATEEQRSKAAVRMEKTNLRKAHLEEAYLHEAHLERANLDEAHLERANLDGAQLEKAYLHRAHLEEAYLHEANLQRANLHEAHLERANFHGAHLEKSYLHGAHLEGTNLDGAWLDSADLEKAIFSDKESGPALLADIRWGEINLTVVDWAPVKRLGDEVKARQTKDVDKYRTAVRANRQLAVLLRNQGLNEEADHFAYRAQLLQRVVWQYQRRWLKYAFSWFLFFLAGYGYRPLRSVLIYLCVIAGFALGYYEVTHLLHAQPYPLAWYEALILSVSSFHGRGFFQPVHSLGDPVAILASIEAVFGLLIEISFIATFTQRFFGK